MDNKSYTTDKKEEFRVLADGGKVSTFYRIWATSAKGTYFHIEVSEKDLSSANSLLDKRAKELDAI